MRHLLKKLLSSVAVALTVTGSSLPIPARAQTYPIDCAILLCLSGGWPASVPCARARAEFIRRITPWPVEPPLQIWRCPMGASYENDQLPSNNAGRIFEALYRTDSRRPLQSLPVDNLVPTDLATCGSFRTARTSISAGQSSTFVRSIRVFDVRYARQHESGRDGDCNRSATVVLGTYGTQGDFSWQRSSITAMPEAHVGLERWGQNCPGIYHRSVFVDWRDNEGNYGFEQVNY